jgi:hypothetical protein
LARLVILLLHPAGYLSRHRIAFQIAWEEGTMQNGNIFYCDGKIVYDGKQWNLQNVETIDESRVKLHLEIAMHSHEANSHSVTHQVVILD